MLGISLRLDRLFKGRFLLLGAMDHGQYVGIPEGLQDPLGFLQKMGSSVVDGIILNAGIAAVAPCFPREKSMILRVTHAGSRYSGIAWDNRSFLQPEEALSLGCDAVIAMCIIGHENDVQSLHELATVVREYHRFGIPVIAEMLPFDSEAMSSVDVIADISRIGAELGADIIKTVYAEGFEKVVASCPVPVIMAGGEKRRDFVDSVKKAVKSGARGLAMGRNLFQSEDPVGLVHQIKASLDEK